MSVTDKFKNLLEDSAEVDKVHHTKSQYSYTPHEYTEADDILNYLDNAAKEEEFETIKFGLETDDGDFILVYVDVNDAAEFENELSELLGEEDDIEELLTTLDKKYNIVDVEWPEDDDVSGETSGEGTEEEDDEILSQIDDILNDLPESTGMSESQIKDMLLLDEDEEITPELKKLGVYDKYSLLGYNILQGIGVPDKMIQLIFQRFPSFKRDLKQKMLDMGGSNRTKIAMALGINESMSVDEDCISNSDGEVEVEIYPEFISMDCKDFYIELDLVEFDQFVEAIGNKEDTIFKGDLDSNLYHFNYHEGHYKITNEENDEVYIVPAAAVKQIVEYSVTKEDQE